MPFSPDLLWPAALVFALSVSAFDLGAAFLMRTVHEASTERDS